MSYIHLTRTLPLEVTFLARVDICGGWSVILVPEESEFKSRTHRSASHRFCLSLLASRSCLIFLWLSTFIFGDLLWEGQRLRSGQCELMVDWVVVGACGLEKAEEVSHQNRSFEELN